MRSEPLELMRGRYHACVAQHMRDVDAAQALRSLAFGTKEADCDRFDADCLHVLIRDRRDQALVCCFRVLVLEDGRDVVRSYSAQFYDLSALHDYDAPMLEVGRFCIHPDCCDPDILRLAWGVLTAFVDKNGIRMLFGCSSPAFRRQMALFQNGKRIQITLRLRARK